MNRLIVNPRSFWRVLSADRFNRIQCVYIIFKPGSNPKNRAPGPPKKRNSLFLGSRFSLIFDCFYIGIHKLRANQGIQWIRDQKGIFQTREIQCFLVPFSIPVNHLFPPQLGQDSWLPGWDRGSVVRYRKGPNFQIKLFFRAAGCSVVTLTLSREAPQKKGIPFSVGLYRLYSSKRRLRRPVLKLKTLWNGNKKNKNFIVKDLFRYIMDKDLWFLATKEYPKKNILVLQKIVRIILESIYEPLFSFHSFGFRPGKTQHTAIKKIRENFKGVNWFIEGKGNKKLCLMGASDRHQRSPDPLLNLLKKKIKDKKFISFLLSNIFVHTSPKTMGPAPVVRSVRPGLLIEPLLFNIIFHEFDMYMEKILKNLGSTGSWGRVPRPGGAKHPKSKLGVLIRESQPARRLLATRTRSSYGRRRSKNYLIIKHLGYVRYATFFLIGILGPRSAICKLKKQICADRHQWCPGAALEPFNLVISSSDPKRNQLPRFLGYIISQKIRKKYKRGGGSVYRRSAEWRLTPKGEGHSNAFESPPLTNHWIRGPGTEPRRLPALSAPGQLSSYRMYLKMDSNIVITYLAKKGFWDGAPKGPIPKGPFGPGSFNSIQGLWAQLERYYHLANDKQQKLGRIGYIFEHSFAKYFAACFRLKTRRQVFKKIGWSYDGPPFKPLFFGFRVPVVPAKVARQRSHSFFCHNVIKYPPINFNFFINPPNLCTRIGIVEGISVFLTNTGVFQIQTTFLIDCAQDIFLGPKG
uniref:Domain X domain-containing protein n=1 Tax=Placozoan sp. BZ2423 TaxID=401705 RepID=A2T447_9METZ|nr:hypothetical protein [Placozoan sp. BZ2423]